MRAPTSIRAAQSTMSAEMQALKGRALLAQIGTDGTDEQADAIISEYNNTLVLAGMPASMQMIGRAAYRAAWGTL